MSGRRYVLTLEVATHDAKIATAMRSLLKSTGAQVEAPTAVKVTSQVVDWLCTTDPIVLMERVLEP